MAAKLAYVILALLASGIAAPRPAHSAPLVTLTGVLRDAYGTAVDHADISVNNGSTYAGTTTDGTGHYALQVAAGSNRLFVVSSDEGSSNPVRAPRQYSVNVPLTLSTDMALDLTLPPVVDIKAHVSFAGGTPVQGAQVSTGNREDIAPFEVFPGGLASGNNEVTQGYTDSSGIAHLTCFPTPHIQRIYAVYRPSSTVLLDFRDNVIALDSVTVQFQLPSAPITLSGVLRDAYGTAVDRANISVGNDSTSAATTTDGTGHYALQVAAGSNRLTVSVFSSDEGSSNPVRAPRQYSVSVPLTLSTDMALDLTLPPVVDVEAHVASAGGAPVQGALVYTVDGEDIAPFEVFPGGLASGHNEVTRGYTDSSGIAHLTCFPTPRIQRIYAVYRPSSTVLLDFRDNVIALDSVTVQFQLPSAPITLSGVLRDAYGTAVDRANISVGNGSTSAGTTTDGTGHYALQVAAGSNRLTVSVFSSDEGSSNPVRAPRQYSVSVPLTLSTDIALDLTLPPVVDVEAHVTSAGGAPVQGALVYIVDGEDIAPFEVFPGGLASGHNEVTRGYTDSSGIAHLTCFPTPHIKRIYADYRRSSTLLRDFRDNVVALDSVTIYFVLDAPTPTLISATSELLPGVVKLRWYASDYAGRQVRIERCALDKAWSALSQGAFNGSGMLLFEDTSVDPVMSYGYRVRLGNDDASVGEGEVWVTTIGNTAPGLTVLTNPSFGGVIRAHCQLPSQDGGTVALLDVAGRVLLEQRVTPTVSELTLRPNAAPPGIYFVRIRQGAFEIVKKAVVAGR